MIILIDIGNTRTKWKLSAQGEEESPVQACLNSELADSKDLKQALKQVTKAIVSCVAKAEVLSTIQAIAPKLPMHVVHAQAVACDVRNSYETPTQLGSDRWAALIAAWHLNKQPTLVVNVGTAVTIDALARDNATRNGVFIGGTIMPGLHLMQNALNTGTAQVAATQGKPALFPKNTQNAVYQGCLNATVGAILLMQKELERHSAYLPKVVIAGGDANMIAEALKPHLKRVIISENLVLQGLALLEKEGL